MRTMIMHHVPGCGNKYDTPEGTAKEPPNETPKEVPGESISMVFLSMFLPRYRTT